MRDCSELNGAISCQIQDAGLDLCIVKFLVELQNGKIQATSELDDALCLLFIASNICRSTLKVA